MSRKMIYDCDRCVKPIIGTLHTLDLGNEPVADIKTAKDTDHKLFDMCGACWQKLLSFLRGDQNS